MIETPTHPESDTEPEPGTAPEQENGDDVVVPVSVRLDREPDTPVFNETLDALGTPPEITTPDEDDSGDGEHD